MFSTTSNERVREVEPLRVADAKFEAAPDAIASEAHVLAAHVDTDEAVRLDRCARRTTRRRRARS